MYNFQLPTIKTKTEKQNTRLCQTTFRGRDRLSVIEKMADILNAMLGVEAVFKSVFRN